MKYLKKYEEVQNEYGVGDYVLLDLDEIDKDNEKNGYSINSKPDGDCGKIISKDSNELYPYGVKLYTDDIFLTKNEEIKRLLKPAEIEEFKIKKELYFDTKKFKL